MMTVIYAIGFCCCALVSLYFLRRLSEFEKREWLSFWEIIQHLHNIVFAAVCVIAAIVMVVLATSQLCCSGAEEEVVNLSGEKPVAAEIVYPPCRCSCEEMKTTVEQEKK